MVRGVYLPDGPFRGSTAIARGWLTRGQLRARCVRVFPDVYLRRSAPLDLVTRSHAALVLVRMRGVLAGWSAAALYGASCVPSGAPAELVVPRFVRAAPGLVTRYHRLARDEVTEIDEQPLTTPLRTAYDLARVSPTVTEAVVRIDALARRGRFSPGELLALAARYPGARGAAVLRRAVPLADPSSESPMESRTRMVLVWVGCRSRRCRSRYGTRTGGPTGSTSAMSNSSSASSTTATSTASAARSPPTCAGTTGCSRPTGPSCG